MFEIKREKIFRKEQIKIINKNTQEYIAIIPECGGLVNELVLSKASNNYSIIDGYTTVDDLNEYRMHKSSKLIPFPNRIKDGKYEFSGKKFQLPINQPDENHAIHGFIYDKKFKITNTEINDNEASITLEYSYNGEIEGYPFKFITEMIYTLTAEDGFNCQTLVQNLGETSMPFGDGWHPYFKFDKKVDELLLKIPTDIKTMVDERMIPTGEILPFNNFNELTKINYGDLDTGFRIAGEEGFVETEIFDPEENLKIKIYQETGEKKYNFLQIYIPASRESIAIEPMTCNTDAFNNKDGLIVLEPGEVFEGNYGVKVE
ncbi:aldose 1-epimerase [candidate division KSB1 bacterium]|nr:aldose 1-epimerase [candidate division KSB1 bacterium]